LRAQIEILASLQSVDREIREQTGIKQGLLVELRIKETEIDAKKQEVEALTALLAEKEKLRREKDRIFQDEGKKVMDKRMRMNRIKNIKELQALQREIDQIKQSNIELEEALIQIMVEIDGIKANIKAKEDEMAQIQGEWQQKQQELQSQITGIDRAVSEAAMRRQTIASQVDILTPRRHRRGGSRRRHLPGLLYEHPAAVGERDHQERQGPSLPQLSAHSLL